MRKKKSNKYRLSSFTRTSYLALAVFMIAYSIFSASTGMMSIPLRHRKLESLPLEGFASALMCFAFLCGAANLIASAMQPESRKHDARYTSIFEFAKVFGWLFFILAIIAAIFETRRPPIE